MPIKRMCAAAANTPTYLVVAGVKRYSRYNTLHVVMKMWRPACIHSVQVHQTRMKYTRLLLATFLYIRILNMSFDLILPVCLKIIDGKTVDQTSLSDTMQIIIGKQHHPYGLVAVMMLIVFNIQAPCVFFFCFSILASVFQLPLHTEKCNPCLRGSLPRLL